MKILSLTAENIKKLTAVEITPDGALVQITGANGAGKTSVLDSIWWALAGTRNIQASPIHRDAKKGRIKLDLGDLIVERRFTAQEDGGYTTTLKVSSADGSARYGTPQKMLDALLGALAFDPLAFSRMKPDEQRDALRRFVDLDLDAIDAQNRADYDARRDLNREAKSLTAQIDALDAPAEKPAPIDVSALAGELEQAGQHNAECSRVASIREDRVLEREDLERRIVALKAEINAAEAQIATIARDEDEDTMDLRHIDTSAITAKMAEAESRNAAVRTWHRRVALQAMRGRKQESISALTAAMAVREEKKVLALAESSIPVEGLGITTDGITLDGLPFEVASDAEQLRVSVALAAAMNPDLRVIRIRDGSLLDEENLASLGQWAEEHDMQVWIERVDSSGKVGFVIEDGRLAEASDE